MPIELKHLEGTKVLIVGLGESGLAMARFCVLAGADITVCDSRAKPPGLDDLVQNDQAIKFIASLAPDALGNLKGYHFAAWSPGLSPRDPLVSPLIAALQGLNIPILGEIEIFARALAALEARYAYRPKVVAITGTNGKTTTTLLAAHLIRAAGLAAVAAGNLSPSALAALQDHLNQSALPQAWVLELSSFQLEWTQSLRCDVATVLNITQDHLDWHADMTNYRRAKLKIYQGAQVGLVNRDDPLTMPAQRIPRMLSFGVNEVKSLGDFGLDFMHGHPWFCEAVAAEDEMPGRRRSRAETKPFRVNRLAPVEVLPLIGTHNQANALAALAICRALDLPLARPLKALSTFRPEAHRCQTVREIASVVFVDDSKGTNVGATVAALSGLGRPVVLIAGGDGKAQDFSPLATPIREHARAVILIGKDATAIRDAIIATGVPVELTDSLESAVQRAAALAKSGDAVLLSPACASFDMFKNYIHRAQAFRDAVFALPEPDSELVATEGDLL